MTLYHIMSTVIVILIMVGLWKRKEMSVHIPVMLTAFGLDVLLVLLIELNRGAIEKVVQNAQSQQGHTLLFIHVAVSVITILLYIVLTVLGFKIVKGQRSVLKLHRNLGALFVLCRLTNYVTSFMIIPS